MIGSYRIVRPLGRGGMGTVYEARHTLLARRAAIKVMHAELRKHPGMASRMVQEAMILDELHHPGIVRVYECGLLPDHRPWIAMELVEGDALADRMAVGPLDAGALLALLSAVAQALEPAHRHGIVHRDLKPDNILLTPRDPRFPVRVIDWGIARLGPVGRLTIEGSSLGTPVYMSPEQACGGAITPASDIYALGVVAYEALCGEAPFDGHSLGEIVCLHISGEVRALQTRCPGLPREVCTLVHRMLAKDPADRPTAGELSLLASITPDASDRAPSDYPVTPALALDRLRWTPELPPQRACYLIGPRGPLNQVAGEITTKS
jgi:serine/threonine-protein kinase